jgi:hypothetical protein
MADYNNILSAGMVKEAAVAKAKADSYMNTKIVPMINIYKKQI